MTFTWNLFILFGQTFALQTIISLLKRKCEGSMREGNQFLSNYLTIYFFKTVQINLFHEY